MLMSDKLKCETKGRDDWNARYGPEFGLNLKGERDVLDCYPDMSSASTAIVILGGNASKGAGPAEMLTRRVERGFVEWKNTRANSILIATGENTAEPIREL